MKRKLKNAPLRQFRERPPQHLRAAAEKARLGGATEELKQGRRDAAGTGGVEILAQFESRRRGQLSGAANLRQPSPPLSSA